MTIAGPTEYGDTAALDTSIRRRSSVAVFATDTHTWLNPVQVHHAAAAADKRDAAS